MYPEEIMNLQGFFTENRSAALAFSGGVDSAYLLYAGLKYGCDLTAYYVKAEFQPQFELDDAMRLAEQLGARMKVIRVSVLGDEDVRANGPRRCYFCKRQIFSKIMEAAKADGYSLVLDGTNASDDADDRPGMQALMELSVRSPLRECGLTKAQIRDLSKEAGLFTWNKPAYACLATRIQTGMAITEKDLEITEYAESTLAAMGFRDFRVRKIGESAKLQVREEQLPLVLERRREILDALNEKYKTITLDLEFRK